MKVIALICRLLLGALFVFSGFNILHPLGAAPTLESGSPLAQFTGVMMASGWMKTAGFLQLVGGLLVLSGGALPLGLCLLCPITVNILLCHILLMGGHDIAGGAVATVLELVLIYAYRGSFRGILSFSERPTL